VKPIAKRISLLESRIQPKPSQPNNDYRGIRMDNLIQEMTSEERDCLRQALIFARDNADYKTREEFKLLEASAESAMDGAHYRISNNSSRHLE
jgi:hypothetical protein